MSDRVLQSEARPKVINRLGGPTPRQRSEILQRFSRDHPKCFATRLRSKQNRHERGRPFPPLVKFLNRPSQNSTAFSSPSAQALLRLPQLLLLLLLGRRQRLGPHPLFPIRGTQQPRTPVGPAAPHAFPQQRNVLRHYRDRSHVTLHLEFQAFAAFGPL